MITEYDFVSRSLCYLEERLTAGCMVPINLDENQGNIVSATTKDIIHCATACAKDGSCVGCSRNLSSQAQPGEKLYQHWPCHREFPLCLVGNPGIQ